jgi:hypothetical protein
MELAALHPERWRPLDPARFDADDPQRLRHPGAKQANARGR